MRHRSVYIAYTVLCVCLWPLPLLNVLHVESSAVVAAAAFFISGWTAIERFSRASTPRDWLSVAGALLVALLVPWAMLTVSVLWAPNCGYLQGLGLFLLFAPVSSVLGTAVAYALTGIGAPSAGAANEHHPHPTRRGWLVGIGVAVIFGGLVYDYAFHPQFFSYNHVFGGILGPIYDEQLAIRPGLFWFRGMTLLWILLLVAAGTRLRGYGGPWARVALPVSALLLGVGYFFSTSLGFNVTEASLKQALPGTHRTAHFEIHYEPSAHSPAEVASWGRMQERSYAELAQRLKADPAEKQRFLTFVYPSPEAKAMLTGARTTSVAPVWLNRAQSHLLVSRLEASFQHELAHLFSRSYGLPGLNASWSVGLVEGWAVALEPPSIAPSPDDLVRAARGRTGLGHDLTKAVEARLSPFGFWTDRGAVSYTTMGSFVSYLLEAYGAERLKKVYALANFEAVYGRSVEELTKEWAASLEAHDTIHASAGRSADRSFSRLSLFETECPHYVPQYRQRLQEGSWFLSRGDTTAAQDAFRTALRLEPRSATAHVQLARIRLAKGETDAVLRQLDSLGGSWTTPSVEVIRADVYARSGAVDSARVRYRSALSAWPAYAADVRAELLLRSLSAHDRSLVNVWTSRASAETQAQRFGDRAEAEGSETTSGILATVWAAQRWMEADRPGKAAVAWRRARDSAQRWLTEKQENTSSLPNVLQDTHHIVQRLTSTRARQHRPGTGPFDAETVDVSSDHVEGWPRAWKIRLAHQLARATFIAARDAISSARSTADVRNGAEVSHDVLSPKALSKEADAVAAYMHDLGAEHHARIWRHLAQTIRLESTVHPVAESGTPARDEFGPIKYLR
jgi:tetratricopeptide (TPR) repeat protein